MKKPSLSVIIRIMEGDLQALKALRKLLLNQDTREGGNSIRVKLFVF